MKISGTLDSDTIEMANIEAPLRVTPKRFTLPKSWRSRMPRRPPTCTIWRLLLRRWVTTPEARNYFSRELDLLNHLGEELRRRPETPGRKRVISVETRLHSIAPWATSRIYGRDR